MDTKKMDSKIDDAAKKVTEVVRKVSHLAANAADKLGVVLDKSGHRSEEMIENASHTAREVKTKVVHAAEETAQKVVHAANEKVNKAAHRGQELADKAGVKPNGDPSAS
jgi:hypothetical protein